MGSDTHLKSGTDRHIGPTVPFKVLDNRLRQMYSPDGTMADPGYTMPLEGAAMLLGGFLVLRYFEVF